MPTLRRLPSRSRRVLAAIATLGLSLLSCGRDVTGPGEGLRYATGLSFLAEFPAPLADVADGAGSVVPFERVRVVFRRGDESVALDTSIVFPANVDSMALDLRVALSPGAPASGEPMALSLDYVNAAGDTVFRGGPVPVVAVPRAAGSPPPEPAPVPLTYTGPGATATSLDVTPETLTVVAGDPFSFTATALDGQGAPVANAPIVFTSLDPARATLTARNAGAGATTTLRGSARVLAQLVTGAADDTVALVVLPRPGSLALVSGGTQSAAPNTALATPITVRLLATDGQPLADAPVSVTPAVGSGATVPSSPFTDANGLYTFTWTLGAAAGAQTATIQSPGATDLVVTATAVVANATQLVITQEIPASPYAAGDSLPALVVEARTAGNARDSTFADSVFLSFDAGSPAGATFTGTTRVQAVAGIARFDNFRLTRAGITYRLAVNAAGLTPDTSTTIAITPRAASVIALSTGGGQAAAPDAALPQPVVVRAADPYDNPVAGVIVGFSVASGSVGATVDTTDVNGLASTSWTLGTTTGGQTLTATADGLTGSPISVSATATSGVATTTLAPQFDTLTAIGANRLLVATARDGANAVVPGAFTWLSRDPAIATVNDTGRVVAVTNGETWVVATEAGGTRDSARIVVQQRLASITVTPGNRNIYLGAQFTFTASAVDGLGVPLASQPAFVWSSGTPAVATLDSLGVARGVGLGAAQVRATALSVTGTANLSVLTPITRIAVVRDSIGFVATDTFTLSALQQSRSYRAVAYDTLDVAMTGITFAWASSNPSVATIDSSGATTARARAAANGFTAVRATAQGITGAAALNVAQVMTAIDLTPANVTVAVGGQTVLTPRRLDANGFFIPGGSFTFASVNPAIATVSGAGVVSGVELGTTTVTASSGATTSNAITVNVSASAPAVLSWGRDTLAIGRSATNVGFPVYLSRPSGTAVTVNLAVVDTFAFFSPTSVTIPQGATSGTAFLNGRNAGTTQIIATDAASTYAPDTAVLAVQASVRFSTTSYSTIVTQEIPTQILLTDPAPSGGTFITYSFGTAGRASVSPDPAFIPAGQLSANVVIRGLAAGTTTITPAATGVSGQATNVTISPASLTYTTSNTRLGAGQYQDGNYVYAPQNLTAPLTVTVTSSDTTIVTAPTSVVIPAGINYAYVRFDGRTAGAATLTFSAPGWTPFVTNVVVTTPNLVVSGGGAYNTTQPPINVTVATADSTRNGYYRTSGLAVQLSSSDTTVLRIVTQNVTVGAGQYFVTGQVAPGGNPGTARLYATASGHRTDSVSYSFTGPKLQFSWNALRLGARQFEQNVYVYAPNNPTSPLTVTLTATTPAVGSAPASVTIPTTQNFQYFNVNALTPGTTTFIATAPGYEPDTATLVVTSPQIHLFGGGILDNFAAAVGITTYIGDSTTNSGHYSLDTVIVSYTSSDPAVLTVTAADTILPNEFSTTAARVTPVGEGTALIIVTSPGRGADTISYTVRTPKLNFSFATYRIGLRQYRPPAENYVYTPTARSVSVPVTITRSNPVIDSLSATSFTIPANNNLVNLGFAGMTRGVDTLIASAPGYLPDTAVIIVTSPRFILNGIAGTATTTSPSTTAFVQAADSVGNAHYVLDSVRVGLLSSNIGVVQFDSTAVMIPRGNYFAQPRYRYTGPGTATISVVDSSGLGYSGATSNAVTVTGPSLTMSNPRPTLGMRQTGLLSSSYVQIPNPIGTPLVVTLVSTDSMVARVQPSVTIPAGQTFAYFRIDAQDQTGTVQIQASAPGYGPASFNQQVTVPRFLIFASTPTTTTALPQATTVQAADAAGTAHYVSENVTITLTSSNPAAGTIDSASVVIVAGDYFNNRARFVPGAVGSTTITASDPRGTSYSYTSASTTIAVNQPNLAFSWGSPMSLGVGQYIDQSVSVPNTRLTPLEIALAHRTTASATPATVTMNVGTNSSTVRLSGVSVGADTLVATATGHNSTTAPIAVGLGRLDFISGLPTTVTTDSVLVTVFARSPDTGVRNVLAATTLTLGVSGSGFELRSGGVAVSSVTIPANGSSVSFYIRRLAGGGSGTFTVSHPDYTTYTTPTITVNP
ncbi:MAG: Ig-like domain-containing protein [Gemmatimonadaceae bacterium]|nr:Ig-like domain-containing protein [Gemmatimonadaceae bacterium]